MLKIVNFKNFKKHAKYFFSLHLLTYNNMIVRLSRDDVTSRSVLLWACTRLFKLQWYIFRSDCCCECRFCQEINSTKSENPFRHMSLECIYTCISMNISTSISLYTWILMPSFFMNYVKILRYHFSFYFFFFFY